MLDDKLFAGARYYLKRDVDTWQVPYSYEETSFKAGGYTVCKTEHALPLAFVTTKALAQSDYQKLTMLQRQEALLQGVVLPDDQCASAGVQQADISLSSKVVPMSVTCDEGISYEDGSITVSNPDAHLHIECQGLAQSETYLVLSNLELTPKTPGQPQTGDESLAQRARQLYQIASWVEPTRSYIYLWVGDNQKSFEMGTPKAVGFSGKVDWASCLGYSEQGLDSFELSFEEAGTYTFDSFEVVCQPVEPVIADADKLATGAMSDLQLNCNQVKARANSPAQKSLAMFTLAYSQGWSATVDGKSAPVLKADDGFMAIPLEGEGEHQIELHYVTPGLVVGAGLSLLGLILLIVLAVRAHRIR